jgi:hypothetical protein
MRRILCALRLGGTVAGWGLCGAAFAAGSGSLVVSQIYGGGGSTSAPWKSDYISCCRC